MQKPIEDIPETNKKSIVVTRISSFVKFIVFFGLLLTAAVLFYIRSPIYGSIILLTLGEFMLYNKVEAMDK